MSYYADIYVILKTRSKALSLEFMEHFLPEREESASFYEFPRFGKKVVLEFEKATDLMAYMEANPSAEHGIYWRNVQPKALNRHGMLFYTSDAYMIFGISRDQNGMENQQNEKDCLTEMKHFFDTEEGYITYECPPENNFPDFITAVKAYQNAL